MPIHNEKRRRGTAATHFAMRACPRAAHARTQSGKPIQPLHRFMRHLRYVVLADSDHYIPEIKPAEVAELVSQVV